MAWFVAGFEVGFGLTLGFLAAIALVVIGVILLESLYQWFRASKR